MSVFSDIFSEGMAALAEADGELVLYACPGESELRITAIVGNETVRKITDDDAGTILVRVREFTIQLSDADPRIDGIITYLDEPWTITGEKSRSLTAVRVVCEREPLRERTKRKFRGGSH